MIIVKQCYYLLTFWKAKLPWVLGERFLGLSWGLLPVNTQIKHMNNSTIVKATQSPYSIVNLHIIGHGANK